jgi:hypothetical protein
MSFSPHLVSVAVLRRDVWSRQTEALCQRTPHVLSPESQGIDLTPAHD